MSCAENVPRTRSKVISCLWLRSQYGLSLQLMGEQGSLWWECDCSGLLFSSKLCSHFISCFFDILMPQNYQFYRSLPTVRRNIKLCLPDVWLSKPDYWNLVKTGNRRRQPALTASNQFSLPALWAEPAQTVLCIRRSCCSRRQESWKCALVGDEVNFSVTCRLNVKSAGCRGAKINKF